MLMFARGVNNWQFLWQEELFVDVWLIKGEGRLSKNVAMDNNGYGNARQIVDVETR